MKNKIETKEIRKGLSLVDKLTLWKEGLQLVETDSEIEIKTNMGAIKRGNPNRVAKLRKDGSDYQFETPTPSTNSEYSWVNFQNGKALLGERSYDLSLHYENQFGTYYVYYMKNGKLFPFVAMPKTSMGGHSIRYNHLDGRDELVLAEFSPLVKIANKIRREVMKGGNK